MRRVIDQNQYCISTRLATELGPPGGRETIVGFWCRRRLAARGSRQAMAKKFVVSGAASAWRWKRFRQAVVAEMVIYGALGAWRHVSPARRSGSWQRLAVRVPRQAIDTVAA